MFVAIRVRADKEIYDLFLCVWSNLNIDGGVHNLLIQGTKSAEAANNCEYIFSEKDVVTLLKLLNECSFKWEQLGVLLKLPQHKIEEYKSSCSDNDLRLSYVLREWIIGRKRELGSPTLSTLVETLAGGVIIRPKFPLKRHSFE